jgi:hypothetical protein
MFLPKEEGSQERKQTHAAERESNMMGSEHQI